MVKLTTMFVGVSPHPATQPAACSGADLCKQWQWLNVCEQWQ